MARLMQSLVCVLNDFVHFENYVRLSVSIVSTYSVSGECCHSSVVDTGRHCLVPALRLSLLSKEDRVLEVI